MSSVPRYTPSKIPVYKCPRTLGVKYPAQPMIPKQTQFAGSHTPSKAASVPGASPVLSRVSAQTALKPLKQKGFSQHLPQILETSSPTTLNRINIIAPRNCLTESTRGDLYAYASTLFFPADSSTIHRLNEYGAAFFLPDKVHNDVIEKVKMIQNYCDKRELVVVDMFETGNVMQIFVLSKPEYTSSICSESLITENNTTTKPYLSPRIENSGGTGRVRNALERIASIKASVCLDKIKYFLGISHDCSTQVPMRQSCNVTPGPVTDQGDNVAVDGTEEETSSLSLSHKHTQTSINPSSTNVTSAVPFVSDCSKGMLNVEDWMAIKHVYGEEKGINSQVNMVGQGKNEETSENADYRSPTGSLYVRNLNGTDAVIISGIRRPIRHPELVEAAILAARRAATTRCTKTRPINLEAILGRTFSASSDGVPNRDKGEICAAPTNLNTPSINRYTQFDGNSNSANTARYIPQQCLTSQEHAITTTAPINIAHTGARHSPILVSKTTPAQIDRSTRFNDLLSNRWQKYPTTKHLSTPHTECQVNGLVVDDIGTKSSQISSQQNIAVHTSNITYDQPPTSSAVKKLSYLPSIFQGKQKAIKNTSMLPLNSSLQTSRSKRFHQFLSAHWEENRNVTKAQISAPKIVQGAIRTSTTVTS